MEKKIPFFPSDGYTGHVAVFSSAALTLIDDNSICVIKI